MKNFKTLVWLYFVINLSLSNIYSQNYSKVVYPDHSGKLVYEQDDRGSKIPDYSISGYRGGGVPIPDVPVVKTVEPGPGDDRQRIQDAIDWVADNISPGPDHYKGAVLLKRGIYEISEPIIFGSGKNGIVLRGEGAYGNGTVIIHRGTDSEGSIHIQGGRLSTSKMTDISDPFVPVGTHKIKVNSTAGMSVGQQIVIKCLHTQKWIDDLQQSDKWTPGQFELKWERTITAIDESSNTITINGPITSQIDQGNGYANGEVHALLSDTRRAYVGVEDMILMSDYDRSVKDEHGYYVDEQHAQVGVYFIQARDCWMRRVTGFFYYWCLTRVRGVCSRVTIEDCAMFDGVSTDTPNNHTGTRDYYFCLDGDQTFCQRSYGRYGRHTFVMNGERSSIVFLDCYSEKEHLSCEPHQRWTHGSLYDNVYNDAIFRLNASPGGNHGWRAANCMMWNLTCENFRYWEADIWLDKPRLDLGKQWAIGIINNGEGKGIANPGSTLGDTAHLESAGTFVEPRSLYLAQLKDRLGDSTVANIASAEQYVSCQAGWEFLLDQYQDIPEFGDPDNLNWLPDGHYFCLSPSKPTIDGIMEESWLPVTSHKLEKRIVGTPASDADLSASFRGKWDQDHIYILVEVKDSILINDSEDQPLEDDAVAVFIDGNNDRATAYDANDHQYIFRWNDTTVYEYQKDWQPDNPAGITFAQDTTAQGYIMEIQIAWDAIGVAPDNRSLFGMDIHIVDDDTGGSPDKKIAWISPSHLPGPHQSTFGTVLLNSNMDQEKPVIISSPEDQILYASDSCKVRLPDYTVDVEATDNVDDALNITQTPDSGSFVSQSEIEVTITVSDDNGNTAEATFTVQVLDQMPPVITSTHHDQWLEAESGCQATLPNYIYTVTATDNCYRFHELELFQYPAPYITVYDTATRVTLSVTDPEGNSSQVSFQVSVQEEVDPTISCPEDKIIDLQEGQADYTISGTGFDPVSVDDNCLVAIVSNNLNDSSTLNGIKLSADTTVTWTVTDGSGNQAQCSFDVAVNSTGILSTYPLGIRIYPNPTGGMLHYESNKTPIQKISLLDVTGNMILEMRNPGANGTINISHLNMGIYFTQVSTRDGSWTKKIIKE